MLIIISYLHALELYVPVAEHLAIRVAVLDKLVQLFGVLLAGHQQAVQQARHGLQLLSQLAKVLLLLIC
jgi:hypothetical protein